MMASDASASMTSFAVIPPTAPWMSLTSASSRPILATASLIASSEPWASALTMILSSVWSSVRSDSSNWASRSLAVGTNSSWDLTSSARSFACLRAMRSLATTSNMSPAVGTSSHPMTSTGDDGAASRTRFPFSSNIALTRPAVPPATMASPRLSVPRWTTTVATGPLPTSSCDSMTVPTAGAFGFALSSSTSATSVIMSSNSSIP